MFLLQIHYNNLDSILHSRIRSEQRQYGFVCSKHDGGARDNSEHVWYEAAVECHDALLLPYQSHALDDAGILEVTIFQRSLS